MTQTYHLESENGLQLARQAHSGKFEQLLRDILS